METYDIIVIGSGSGLTIVGEALGQGLKVALIDQGPPGGTCLNLGCIPSKMLIFPADRIMEIRDSGKLGIEAEIKRVDFPAIMERMRKSVRQDRDRIRNSIAHIDNLDYYVAPAHFVNNYTLEVKGEPIRGQKIFIGAGTRPLIPGIRGIENVNYLTNESVLNLEQKPESLIIVGGGYVGVEYAHFFSAVGTRVSIIEMGERLVQAEEPEISELLRKRMGERTDIRLDTQVLDLSQKGTRQTMLAKDLRTGKEERLEAEAVMIAAGRIPNSDLLKLENTGVEVDRKGFIRVDDFLESTAKQIYAFGDIIGRYMFTHVANREALQAWHNATHGEPSAMDYRGVPHAVFSYPQIASVGLTEAEARKRCKILVGRAQYSEVAKGMAMMEEDGFAKAIVEKDTEKILGFHIIGPEAATLIQEVIDVMAGDGHIDDIRRSMHIHPAMPEIIQRALSNLAEPRSKGTKPERLKSIVPAR
jgi:mycothione reductase